MSLYHKYRPSGFSEIMGNEAVVSSLLSLFRESKTPPQSVLFTGPTGCGKTTLARILAEKVGAKGMDIREINSSDFRGIDTIRDISKNCQFAPVEGDARVYIIDECHKLTGDAQNAFLKKLEDPPSHVYFFLCTTEPQKLIAPIRGRCSTFEVKPLEPLQLMKLLRKVVKAEGDNLSKVVYDQIIQDSLGHPRNALNILEQVLSVEDDQRLMVAQQKAEEQTQAIALCRALIGQKGWGVVNKILQGLKDQDPETIRRIVMGYASAVLLKSTNDTAGLVLEMFIEPFYNSGFPGLVYACYSVTNG